VYNSSSIYRVLEAEKVGEKKEFMTSSGCFTHLKTHHSFQKSRYVERLFVPIFMLPNRSKDIIEEMVILQNR
jgi:hypothetical protein